MRVQNAHMCMCEVIMSCLYPGKAFDTGNLTENGKADYIIMPYGSGDLLELSHANSIKRVAPSASLVRFHGKTYLSNPVPIPCNHCVGCRLEEARQWKERVVLESKNYPPEQRLFITLTYDDEHLPLNNEGEPVVNDDYKQFIKNIRNHYGYKSFRYFGCAEYGTIGHRPHFHIILFGPVPALEPIGCNKFNCVPLELAWPKGLIDVELAEAGSVAYVCGYCEKKAADPNWFTYPVKPFRFMSDRPGIGFSELAKVDLTKDTHVYGNFGSNRRYTSIPQALLRKLDGFPGFKEYKESLKVSGIAANNVKKHVYATSSDCKLGDLRESALLQTLQKNRSDSL